jgi:very-short-patch-repair endonuclease
MHKVMFGNWRPDFVFSDYRILVNADGNYWHSLPRTIDSDKRLDLIAAQNGWRVFRFSESAINISPFVCAEIVVDAIKSSQPAS